jgi:hypothetical protein
VPRLQVPSSGEPVPTSRLQPISRALLQWFAGRGISEATVRRNGVMMEQRYNKLSGQQEDWIAFVYRQDGKASPLLPFVCRQDCVGMPAGRQGEPPAFVCRQDGVGVPAGGQGKPCGQATAVNPLIRGGC